MASTSPARTPKNKKTYDDVAIVSEDPDAETFTARIFDSTEMFTFSTDVNFWLQMNAFSGEPGAFADFMHSLLEVEVEEDDDEKSLDRKRFETKRRFNDVMRETKHLGPERLVQFIADITEIAGNVSPA